MTNFKKSLFGSIGLILVVIMTIIAFLIPTNPAAALDSVTDVIQIRVYDSYPNVDINSPVSDDVTVNPEITVDYLYENVDYVDLVLSYTDEDGNPVEILLEHFAPDPSELDPEFGIASGNRSITINLKDDYGLEYDEYTITATPHSPVGFSDEDIVDFFYVPAKSTQTETDEATNDPIILVEYDDEVEKIEVMAYDENGNPIFDEPIVIEVPSPYEAGSEEVTLPLSSYGVSSSDNYTVELTSYKHITTTDDEGNTISVLAPIDTPKRDFPITYSSPEAPAVPNTGRILKELNITEADSLITISLITAIIVGVALYLLNHRKNYRRNYRRK